MSLPAKLQLSLRQLLEGALVALTLQLVSNEAPVAPGIAASLSQLSDKAVSVISSVLQSSLLLSSPPLVSQHSDQSRSSQLCSKAELPSDAAVSGEANSA